MRGLRAAGLALACLVALGAAAGATGAKPKPKKAKHKPPVIRLNQKYPDVLVLMAPAYRLTLSKENGELLELYDRRAGERVLLGENGCLWSAKQLSGVAVGGCAFDRTSENRFTFGWSPATSTLTLSYGGEGSDAGVDATLTLVAHNDSFDLRLGVESQLDLPVSTVLFPADLYGNAAEIDSGYMPTFLPGVRLLPGFFKGPHRSVETYPSRWAFADFVAADFAKAHFALYTANPAPAPLAPVDIGFLRNADPAPCSGDRFCITHVFQTWVQRGDTWTSPTVTMRVGGSIEKSLAAYRKDNGIDAYPSLRAKLGDRLDVLSRAPLIKADLWKGLPEFRQWPGYLQRLPSPVLIHPVSFQPGGFDEAYPDFLPPDPRWGSSDDLDFVMKEAHALGDMVMPYLNVSWWDTTSPTVQSLPASTQPEDIAVQTRAGAAVREQFGVHDGYVVSPHAPAVRSRIARLMEEWHTQVPADCLFFDQLGARPWRRDFNPAAPTPIAYYDGWLSLFAPYGDRCVMAEDGWDRLARTFTGFHGSVLQMSRQFEWPNDRWGEGNWEPYPIAGWLLHDKVLMYQHDLYDGTWTADAEVLTFNAAFGFVCSFEWDGDTDSLDSPWLTLAGQVQRTLGPYYAGKAMTSYRRLAPGVTESVFEGGFSVVANWNAGPVDVGGRTIAPLGFLARTADGTVLAATFGPAWSGVTFPGGAR
jgi:hypothetical protein